MKIFVLFLAILSFCVPARSGSFTTTDGTTYNNISTQRVDPDGLYIEYALPGGGVGMCKIKFLRMSPEQRKQFGYNAHLAREYEAHFAKATEDNRQEAIRADIAAQADRRTREAQEEKAANILAMQKASRTIVSNRTVHVTGTYGGGAELFLVPCPRTGPVPPATTTYAPVVTPIPMPRITPPPRPTH